MSNQKLKKGQQVFFIYEKLSMTVNEVKDNYAICSRPLHRWYDAELLKHKVEMGGYISFTEAFEDLKNSLVYTIVDFVNKIRGPHNSWGYGIEKETLESDVKEMMNSLITGEIEISSRNCVDLVFSNECKFF